MHHPSPSAITYPSPPALRPIPALLHPALLHTSLPHHQHTTYSTLLYYPPHSPTTSTCPTTHPALLPTSLHHHLHTTYPTTQLSIPDPPTLPMCTLLPIHYCALTCYTYYPVHRTHVPHSPPPCPSPPQMYHAAPISYRLYHTALPRTPLSSI